MSESQRNPEQILRRLEWTVIRRLDGLLHGDYRTLFRGFGLDLADLREYQYHDDVRHIDWNVTARLATPYVREYHEDRELSAWFLLDLSPSLDFGSGTVRKRAVAGDFVALLARLLSRHGNRVGALFYGDRVDTVIPAKSGRRHVLHILHAMLARPERLRSAATDLKVLLQGAFALMRRRSLVFVVSDFISAYRAAPRGRGDPPVRSAGGGAAGSRPGADPGRRDRRAAHGRYARSPLPQPVCAHRGAAREGVAVGIPTGRRRRA
jgi:uncharacterized protein (DUF58 family)